MKHQYPILFFMVLGLQSLQANYAFYRTVNNTCKSYRIDNQQSEMYFGKDELTKDKFYLTVNSNRNNFEMAMIVGFVAVGQAIKQQRLMVEKRMITVSAEPKTVHVSVNIPATRDNLVVTASATAEEVVKLADGLIDSAEFMRLIKNSIVTL